MYIYIYERSERREEREERKHQLLLKGEMYIVDNLFSEKK